MKIKSFYRKIPIKLDGDSTELSKSQIFTQKFNKKQSLKKKNRKIQDKDLEKVINASESNSKKMEDYKEKIKLRNQMYQKIKEETLKLRKHLKKINKYQEDLHENIDKGNSSSDLILNSSN